MNVAIMKTYLLMEKACENNRETICGLSCHNLALE